jgi:hypothetical protein
VATLQELQAALVNADAANDVDSARALVSEIKKAQSTSTSPESVDFSFGKMVKNIPGSLGKLASDLVYPIMHPVDTAVGVGRVARGAVEKLVPGEQEYEKYADQVGQMMVGRYGGMDALKTTIMEDPAGFVADLSAVLTAGGSTAARAPGLVGKLGKATQKVGTAIEPVNIAANLAKSGVRPLVPKGLPGAMYERAAGFSTTKSIPERKALTQTGLDYDLMPTVKGVEKLEKSMNQIDSKINALISSADTTGKTIPSWAVLKHLEKVRKEVGGPRLEAKANLKIVDDIAEDYVNRMRDLGKNSFSVKEMQDWKTDVYDKVRWHPSRPTVTSAKEKSYKAMARGAKESIESIVPEITAPNVEMGRLLDLEGPLQQTAARLSNRSPIPLNASLHTGIGHAIGGPAGAAAGAGVSFLEFPRTRAYTALKLNRLKKQGMLGGFGANNPWLTAIRQGALQAGRIAQEQEKF